MKKSKAKPMTFRQRMRAEAEKKLKNLREQASVAVILVTRDHAINALDLMRLVCHSQNKSLYYRLVTELANEKVAELERIYNNQQELPLKGEESSGDDVS